jgi:metal-dependent amidase/aminoacylase/carboxypeptidase family protein
MGAEDFSFYQKKIQGYTFFLEALKASQYLKQLRIILRFFIDESGFVLGMKTMSNLTVDYMEMQSKNKISKIQY